MKSIRQIIQNILVEQLIKTDLYELANSRQDITRTILNYVPQITKHLMFLKLYPNVPTAHWRTELRTYISNFSDDKLRKTKKKLEADMYFEFLYNNMFEDDIDRLIKLYKEAVEKEGKPEINIDITTIDKQLQKFFKKLSLLCATKKTVTSEDIMQLLDEWEKW